MRATGNYATYRGKDFLVVAGGDDGDGFEYVGLRLGSDGDGSAFDNIVERLPGRRMAKVSPDDLDRYESVTTTGTVDGVTVTLHGVGDVVSCYTLAGPEWASAHGFTGSQHDGWWGDVPLTEITHITETVKDLAHPASSGGAR